MNEGYAAEIVDIKETGEVCRECAGPVCEVYMKVLSGMKAGTTHLVVSCVYKECIECQKNMSQLH